ncbi:DUF917 domain-containing protein [Amycolatopsis nigrescens]|uniref:DUF917 domain-containing protein n=1 Tax=Amycolatopsis nigrescens TaxID=381445 RepID=UPI00036992EC|nr:DUF917 domain-containing protein [Amycolatopsis nigrescens]
MTGTVHSPVSQIGPADVDALVMGADFFGTSIAGSGMDDFRAWAFEVLERCGPVPVVPADRLPPDTLCAAVGIAGSVTAMIELPPSGDEPMTVVKTLEKHMGRPVGAVMPMNAATINGIFPVIAAAELGIPVVDCDGMGRIFPLITQTSYVLAGLPLTPLAATSAVHDVVSMDATAERAERLVRAMLHSAGGWMLLGLYPTEAANLVTGGIAGSVSRVVQVGRLLNEATSHDAIVHGLRDAIGASLLGSGRVVELGPSGRRGPVIQPANPTTVVVREDSPRDRVIRLEAQNELLLAVIDGVLTTAVPDLLCLLDRNSLRMKGLERIVLGDELDVLVVPAAPVWHSAAGLALGGPKAFGLPVGHPKEGSR